MPATSESWKKRREKTVEEYFFNRITKMKNGCWLWRNCRKGRYGWFQYNHWVVGAHQASFKMFKGKLPKGKIVCHTCDDTRCVNPNHLVAGTKKSNREDFMNRNPRARKLCLEASKIGAKGVQNFWDKMSKRQRTTFINRRARIQAAKRGSYEGATL